MADDFTSMVGSVQQPVQSGLQTGAQWAQSAASIAMQTQQLKNQQEDLAQHRQALSMKQGQWFVDNLRQIAPLDNGPYKKALINKFQQGAQQQGIPWDDAMEGALNDPKYQASITTTMNSFKDLFGDKTYDPFFSALGNGIKSGAVQWGPDLIEKMPKLATDLKEHQAQRAFEVSKFGMEQQDQLAKRGGAIRSQYSNSLGPAEKLFNSVPSVKDDDGSSLSDPTTGMIQPDFKKFGNVEDEQLAQTFAGMYNAKARVNGSPEAALLGGQSAKDWLSTMKQRIAGSGAKFSNQERAKIWGAVTHMYQADMNSKKMELAPINAQAHKYGYDPDIVLGDDQKLFNPKSSVAQTQQPETQQQSQAAPVSSGATQNAGPPQVLNPEKVLSKYSPTLKQGLMKAKGRGMNRAQIEKALGSKLPDDLAEVMGVK